MTYIWGKKLTLWENSVGAPNVPMAVISEARRKYTLLDLADWTRHWNAINVQQGSHDKPVELRWPDHFPIRSPTLLRLAILDPDLVPLLCMSSPLIIFEHTPHPPPPPPP